MQDPKIKICGRIIFDNLFSRSVAPEKEESPPKLTSRRRQTNDDQITPTISDQTETSPVIELKKEVLPQAVEQDSSSADHESKRTSHKAEEIFTSTLETTKLTMPDLIKLLNRPQQKIKELGGLDFRITVSTRRIKDVPGYQVYLYYINTADENRERLREAFVKYQKFVSEQSSGNIVVLSAFRENSEFRDSLQIHKKDQRFGSPIYITAENKQNIIEKFSNRKRQLTLGLEDYKFPEGYAEAELSRFVDMTHIPFVTRDGATISENVSAEDGFYAFTNKDGSIKVSLAIIDVT